MLAQLFVPGNLVFRELPSSDLRPASIFIFNQPTVGSILLGSTWSFPLKALVTNKHGFPIESGRRLYMSMYQYMHKYIDLLLGQLTMSIVIGWNVNTISVPLTARMVQATPFHDYTWCSTSKDTIEARALRDVCTIKLAGIPGYTLKVRAGAIIDTQTHTCNAHAHAHTHSLTNKHFVDMKC